MLVTYSAAPSFVRVLLDCSKLPGASRPHHTSQGRGRREKLFTGGMMMSCSEEHDRTVETAANAACEQLRCCIVKCNAQDTMLQLLFTKAQAMMWNADGP